MQEASTFILLDRVQRGHLQEMVICRRAPGISHLLFADDTLLFFKAEQRQAQQVRDIVQAYERGTGQLINRAKCSIVFKNREDSEMQEQVKTVLEVELTAFEAKYLGLPTPVGRMKREQFLPLKEKLRKRLSAYTEKHLSAAAKEVLIKSVAQALPTYIMGAFKLPLGTCDDLTSIIRDFWWGSEKGKRKIAWVAWKDLVMKKCQGGLGFKDMRLFNQAMLARQAWRLIDKPDSLCSTLLKAKYFPRGSVLDSVKSANASATWQAVLYGLELLKKGLIWRICSGTQVRIWRDPWIPRELSLKVISKRGRCRIHWVSELINSDGSGWDRDKLLRIFDQIDREAILNIKLPARKTDDFLAWHGEKSGSFTVRSAYNLGWRLQHIDDATASSSVPSGDRVLWSRVWEGNVPPKVKVFIWKLCKDILHTRANKYARKLEEGSRCTMCGMAAKNSYHATVSYSAAVDLRDAMRKHWLLPEEERWWYSGPDWLLILLDNCNKDQRDKVKLLLWQTWTQHNDIVHGAKNETELTVVAMRKGKEIIGSGGRHRTGLGGREQADPREEWRPRWQRPAAGWIKVNVDGSFLEASGAAGVGFVARDHEGTTIFTACRVLFDCASAVEAEARACVEGIRLASQWCQGPVVLETDCARLANVLHRSKIRELGQSLLEWKAAKVRRELHINNLYPPY
ncbi:hypothetical protein U9M48_010378 [Paspalum notatum var. saurae]|uniref:Uncharacterized protein n=1 Tax=Paspalum notatum var. saurae TaxID=547442 RepID=A0AAQ3STK3_PASNO